MLEPSLKDHFKCFIGLHQDKKIFDSEEEKWGQGRQPTRISMGGIEVFQCKICKRQNTKHWSAY